MLQRAAPGSIPIPSFWNTRLRVWLWRTISAASSSHEQGALAGTSILSFDLKSGFLLPSDRVLFYRRAQRRLAGFPAHPGVPE
jgi:hypothetical protein